MDTLTGGLGSRELLALLFTNIIAFIILLTILRKFAWGPLLGMIDARRDKIKSDYAAAEKELRDAEALSAEFDAKLRDIQTLERERVQEAVKKGEAAAAEIQAQARAKANDLMTKGQDDLEREVRSARLELREQVVTTAIAAAEMVVGEKLDDAKHRQLIENFIQNMGQVRV